MIMSNTQTGLPPDVRMGELCSCGERQEHWDRDYGGWCCIQCGAPAEDDAPPPEVRSEEPVPYVRLTVSAEGEARAQEIAQAWTDVLDLTTALEAARTVMTMVLYDPETADVRGLALDALLHRRRVHGLGLSDAIIQRLATDAERVSRGWS